MTSADKPESAASERFQGAAMVAIFAAGLVLGGMAINSESARRQLATASDMTSILAGHTAAVVNSAMAHNLPVDGLFRAAGGMMRWRLFDSGGPQVWAGQGGWLYLMEELRPWPGADTVMQRRVDTIKRVGDALHAKGIDLLVAVVPDKARVVSATMNGPRSAQANTRYAAFLELLHKQGTPTVDLGVTMMATPQPDQLFWRTDTHWSQQGAALAAATISTSVTTKINHGAKFKTTAAPEISSGPGDLLRLISLDHVPDNLPIKLRPPVDRQYLETTKPVDAPAADGGLLDDGPTIDVALIGSSFSVNANFGGRLQEALGSTVSNFGEAGGGFAGAARHYFTGIAYRDTPPKLVIWEIPERLVVQPINPDDIALEVAFPVGK